MKTTLLISALFLMPAYAAAQSAEDVYGSWVTKDANGHIEITDCGDGTPCGNIVWINEEEASSDKDINNPDESLRGRSLIGLPMVWGFEQKGKVWRKGKVYDPETGRTYRAKLTPTKTGDLKLTGCFGPICQSQTWTPLEAQ